MKTTITRRVMMLAHAIRRAAAARFDCRAAEIIFGECLKMAWAEIKAEANKSQIITNEKGFVVFQHRNWNYNGDKNTWARVDDDKLTEESYRTTFEDPENLGLDDAEDVADDDY